MRRLRYLLLVWYLPKELVLFAISWVRHAIRMWPRYLYCERNGHLRQCLVPPGYTAKWKTHPITPGYWWCAYCAREVPPYEAYPRYKKERMKL